MADEYSNFKVTPIKEVTIDKEKHLELTLMIPLKNVLDPKDKQNLKYYGVFIQESFQLSLVAFKLYCFGNYKFISFTTSQDIMGFFSPFAITGLYIFNKRLKEQEVPNGKRYSKVFLGLSAIFASLYFFSSSAGEKWNDFIYYDLLKAKDQLELETYKDFRSTVCKKDTLY